MVNLWRRIVTFFTHAVDLILEPASPSTNRRSVFKRLALTASLLVVAGPTALLQVACASTKVLAKWAGFVIDLLNQLTPILTDMGVSNIVTLIAKAIPLAQKLKEAFEKNDNVSALTLFDNLTNAQTGVIVEISNAIGVLQGPQRKILLGIMAAASVFLRLIGANISNNVTPADAAMARAARPSAAASMERAAQSDVFERLFAAVRF